MDTSGGRGDDYSSYHRKLLATFITVLSNKPKEYRALIFKIEFNILNIIP